MVKTALRIAKNLSCFCDLRGLLARMTFAAEVTYLAKLFQKTFTALVRMILQSQPLVSSVDFLGRSSSRNVQGCIEIDRGRLSEHAGGLQVEFGITWGNFQQLTQACVFSKV
jgi:hypothetical protein